MYFKKATTGENNVLWYILGVVAVILTYPIGQIPLLLLQSYKLETDKNIGTEEVDEFLQTMDFSVLNINKNVGLLFMILIFVFMMITLMLVVKYFHKRPFKFLITPNKNVNYRKILWAFGFWFILALLFEGIVAFIYPESYYIDFKPLSWLGLIIICLTVLPIQTSFEELFIRGYLMPGISLLTKNKWWPWVITSVVFGMIHMMNPEVSKFGFWTMQLYYISAGLFLGLITILDDSLELALGVHAATNVFGAAFFSFSGSVLQTDTIVKSTDINPYLMVASFLLGAVIFMIVCNKKYNWNGLQRLFDPIGKSYDKINLNSSGNSIESVDSNVL